MDGIALRVLVNDEPHRLDDYRGCDIDLEPSRGISARRPEGLSDRTSVPDQLEAMPGANRARGIAAPDSVSQGIAAARCRRIRWLTTYLASGCTPVMVSDHTACKKKRPRK